MQPGLEFKSTSNLFDIYDVLEGLELTLQNIDGLQKPTLPPGNQHQKDNSHKMRFSSSAYHWLAGILSINQVISIILYQNLVASLIGTKVQSINLSGKLNKWRMHCGMQGENMMIAAQSCPALKVERILLLQPWKWLILPKSAANQLTIMFI